MKCLTKREENPEKTRKTRGSGKYTHLDKLTIEYGKKAIANPKNPNYEKVRARM